MASNLYGAGTKAERNADDVKAGQDKARAEDRHRAGAAAGRDRRSIGTTR